MSGPLSLPGLRLEDPNLQEKFDTLAMALSSTATPRRGKSIIAAEGSRTNTAYGALDNGPDQVTGISVPTGGHICVAFQGMAKSSVAEAGRAAIFIGANQLVMARANSASPVTTAAPVSNTAATYVPVVAFPLGLTATSGATAYTGDVTTGQTLGAIAANTTTENLRIETGGTPADLTSDSLNEWAGNTCRIHSLPAGTYTISVQFKASSGSVTAKNRNLWVWVEIF